MVQRAAKIAKQNMNHLFINNWVFFYSYSDCASSCMSSQTVANCNFNSTDITVIHIHQRAMIDEHWVMFLCVKKMSMIYQFYGENVLCVRIKSMIYLSSTGRNLCFMCEDKEHDLSRLYGQKFMFHVWG